MLDSFVHVVHMISRTALILSRFSLVFFKLKVLTSLCYEVWLQTPVPGRIVEFFTFAQLLSTQVESNFSFNFYGGSALKAASKCLFLETFKLGNFSVIEESIFSPQVYAISLRSSFSIFFQSVNYLCVYFSFCLSNIPSTYCFCFVIGTLALACVLWWLVLAAL